jgi:hypothetical protein
VAYVLWIPDEIARTGSYTLTLPGKTSVTRYTLNDNSDVISSQVIAISGSYQASVSETPVFVKVN